MATKPSALERELKQKRPFPSAEGEAGVAIIRTADVLKRDAERVLAKTGITLQQFNVLRILRGSHPETLPTLEIADRMIERAPGITRLLDRLEKAGLVTRHRCKEDRRQVLVGITVDGLAILATVDSPLTKAGEGRTHRLSKSELQTLIELLARIREERD
jgi:DNA-binding MarR family transcriptional regulator